MPATFATLRTRTRTRVYGHICGHSDADLHTYMCMYLCMHMCTYVYMCIHVRLSTRSLPAHVVVYCCSSLRQFGWVVHLSPVAAMHVREQAVQVIHSIGASESTTLSPGYVLRTIHVQSTIVLLSLCGLHMRLGGVSPLVLDLPRMRLPTHSTRRWLSQGNVEA